MPNVVRKVGAGEKSPASKISQLKTNLHLAPKHRWERVATLIVAFEQGTEFDPRELDYALETASLVQKKLDK